MNTLLPRRPDYRTPDARVRQGYRVISPWIVLIATGAILAIAGCGFGQPARIPAPYIDPDSVAIAIMQKADLNENGSLSENELDSVPGLRAVLPMLDSNSDGQLSAPEIHAWLTSIKESRVAVGNGIFYVVHQGKPLANVKVRLIPEPIMGGGMKVATGVTNIDGEVNPTIGGSPYHGVNYGLYRVEIVGTGNDGKPLPSKYNTKTIVGVALGCIDNSPVLSLDLK